MNNLERRPVNKGPDAPVSRLGTAPAAAPGSSVSLPDQSKPESYVVGEGPEYEALLEAARAQVSEWCPNGYQGNWWGVMGGGVQPTDDGQHKLTLFPSEWPSEPVMRRTLDLTTLRAGAISLLIYCAAVEGGK